VLIIDYFSIKAISLITDYRLAVYINNSLSNYIIKLSMRSERYGSKFVKLGLQIKKIREGKNLTQQKLADKVGLHLSYIGNIEIGAKRPSLETLFQIAEELGVKVSDLFRF
jgi:DNA-binding XRE family transcriptional regulator